MSESDVQHHFSKFGHVTGVKFLPKKSDTIAAFVDFAQVEDARDAHDALNMVRTRAHRVESLTCGPPRNSPHACT